MEMNLNLTGFNELDERELQSVEGGLGALAIFGIVCACIAGATFLGMLGYGIYDGYVSARDGAQAV